MSSSNPWDDDDDDDRPRRRGRRSDGYDEDGDYRGRDSNRDDYDDMPRRASNPGTGMGITSMICGIVAICSTVVGCCCIFGSIGSFISGIMAVIFGFISRSQGGSSGFNMTGIITGFCAILLDILLLILVFGFHAFKLQNNGRF
jgi:hypothetical protein